MPSFDVTPTSALIAAFAVAALVILFVGVRMAAYADRIADHTGLGEAMVGGVLLGAATSLSGTVVSVTAALDGKAALAFSNGVGGIAAQTAFLAIADLTYRKANLEHASADLANLAQAAALMLMLGLPLAAYSAPEIAVFGLHPVSLALLVVYVLSVRAVGRIRRHPMWEPVRTPWTRTDAPDDASSVPLAPLLTRFLLAVLALGAAGWLISKSGAALAERFDVSQTATGALMTAVATSSPELVTTLAAVRRGAVQLAVGGIIGGNVFDVLFLTLSDAAYRPGSLYHAVGPADLFWISIAMVMTAVLLLGMLLRDRGGFGGIGFESFLILALYTGSVALQATIG